MGLIHYNLSRTIFNFKDLRPNIFIPIHLKEFMIQRKFLTFLLLFTFFSGCATTAEKPTGLKSASIASIAANQTLNYSVNWVDEATLQVLDEMDIIIIEDNSSPAGKSIKAATMDQDILIELTSLTPGSTHMKINIQYPENQKKQSTANKIFYQTRQYLLSIQPQEPKLNLERPLNQSKFYSPLLNPGPS